MENENWYALEIDSVLKRLGSDRKSIDYGLSTADARERFEKFGHEKYI